MIDKIIYGIIIFIILWIVVGTFNFIEDTKNKIAEQKKKEMERAKINKEYEEFKKNK